MATIITVNPMEAKKLLKDTMYSTKEAGELLGVSEHTIRRWVKDDSVALTAQKNSNKIGYQLALDDILKYAQDNNLTIHIDKDKGSFIGYASKIVQGVALTAAARAALPLMGTSLGLGVVAGGIGFTLKKFYDSIKDKEFSANDCRRAIAILKNDLEQLDIMTEEYQLDNEDKVGSTEYKRQMLNFRKQRASIKAQILEYELEIDKFNK